MTGEFTIAVHALVFLNHKAKSLSSEELAKNICTNPARVRKVMAKLKKAGLIETKEGADGGYRFSLDPASVNLARVGKALGTAYVSAGWRSGDSDMDCLIASGMAGIMDDIYDALNRRCESYLETVTIAGIDETIFHAHTGNHRKGESL
ncbi:RrF2 family transcriptional regulator [Candidatus Soleaferrea massiliensis]|uniref:RrF2 family transcriptional regulator n=1 Tax=Candidatus Soleaferrea massiliensis TaxID=1470354 RepID=UPI0005915134|nr:Rrf2 family transcriptional regulator [Candidatus Soleaferrea massiliensis]